MRGKDKTKGILIFERMLQPVFRALYDYDAQEGEEVSFAEGDIIEDFQLIEEGWGTGTVQRTGERGMIPSNYIEQD